MTTQTLFNLDTEVKKRAAARAEREGISLSGVLQLMTKAYADGKIEIAIVERPEIPNAKTAKRWAKIDQDIKEGKNLSPLFSSAEGAIEYLKKEAAIYRRKQK